MNKIVNLRFLIGLFFMVIGLILLAGSIEGGDNNAKADQVNRVCGLVFLAFSAVMVWGALYIKKK